MKFKPGDKVCYIPYAGCPFDQLEFGIVKSVRDETCWVVFNCGEEWDIYQEYTGQSCSVHQLLEGWHGIHSEYTDNYTGIIKLVHYLERKKVSQNDYEKGAARIALGKLGLEDIL